MTFAKPHPPRAVKDDRARRLFVLLFLLPTLLCFGIFYLYPIATVFFTSFAKWDYRNVTSPAFYAAGELFTNYRYVLTEYPYFWEAMRNSLLWALIGAVVQVPLATLAALSFSRGLKGARFARNAYIVPNVISSAALALIFVQLYNPRYGVVNQLIRLFRPGFTDNVLLVPGLNFVMMTLAYIFFTGTSTIMILGHIMAVPEQIYEAARIDGARGLKLDILITIPCIKPILKTVTVLAVTSGFLLYNEVFFLTNGAAGTRSVSFIIRELAVTSARTQYARANTIGLIQILVGMLLILIVNLLFSIDLSELRAKRRNRRAA